MTDQERRTSDANKKVMQRFYDEVVNGGNLDLIDELLTDDFVEHEAFPEITPDRAGVKQFFGLFRQAFPDGTFTVEDMVAEGDRVVARVTIRGTQHGEFMGVPPLGKEIEVQAIDIVQFRDGVATAHWGISDTAGMLMQLGALPAPG
jgi:steroid delta-isomerase-like uncharacterized protein